MGDMHEAVAKLIRRTEAATKAMNDAAEYIKMLEAERDYWRELYKEKALNE